MTHTTDRAFRWTEEKIEKLRQLAASGCNDDQSAEALGVSVKSVKECRRHRGITSGWARQRWSEEADAALCRMYDEGRSAGQMAPVLGTTRNAVIGRLSRLGLRRNSPISAAPKQRPANYRAHRTLEGARRDMGIINRMRAKPKFEGAEATMLPDESRTDLIGIMALNGATCHWPIGEKPIMYCGHPTREHSAYCPHHHAIAHRGGVTQEHSDEHRAKVSAAMTKYWAMRRAVA